MAAIWTLEFTDALENMLRPSGVIYRNRLEFFALSYPLQNVAHDFIPQKLTVARAARA